MAPKRKFNARSFIDDEAKEEREFVAEVKGKKKSKVVAIVDDGDECESPPEDADGEFKDDAEDANGQRALDISANLKKLQEAADRESKALDSG